MQRRRACAGVHLGLDCGNAQLREGRPLFPSQYEWLIHQILNSLWRPDPDCGVCPPAACLSAQFRARPSGPLAGAKSISSRAERYICKPPVSTCIATAPMCGLRYCTGESPWPEFIARW
ncbi:hypothetical protein X907_0647 [Glycocaulis alkaliphilus]|uniref:Uncharacterized protein n=1 Tax=Glycocaulis alkaliphilus TaxID=1434191 RepID=A0A3T0E786_9PROT|nr:hypothetical protein X907_0647 [Glycocaulis alkaliphilus]